jgi:hypothetical protein
MKKNTSEDPVRLRKLRNCEQLFTSESHLILIANAKKKKYLSGVFLYVICIYYTASNNWEWRGKKQYWPFQSKILAFTWGNKTLMKILRQDNQFSSTVPKPMSPEYGFPLIFEQFYFNV